jgi:hypothetical protein
MTVFVYAGVVVVIGKIVMSDLPECSEHCHGENKTNQEPTTTVRYFLRDGRKFDYRNVMLKA